MRTKLLLMIGVCLAMSTMTAQAVITDVFIFPEEPIIYDEITINVFGEENFNISVSDSFLTIDGTLLELDIHLQEGMMPIVTPWSHTVDVGTLPIDTYDLTVNTWIDTTPIFNDTYYTSFEVVPEPATVLLLGFGGLVLRS